MPYSEYKTGREVALQATSILPEPALTEEQLYHVVILNWAQIIGYFSLLRVEPDTSHPEQDLELMTYF